MGIIQVKQIKGIIPALLTPFGAENKINDAVLKQLVTYNLNIGVDGFYVGGTTAETFLLTLEERKHVLSVAMEATQGKCIMIAHVGSIATDHTIELAKYSEQLGYDVISAVPPFYYKYSFEEIKNYYFDIINSVNLPMLIYNIPNFSGVTFSFENFDVFLSDKRFIGVKFTSSDMYLLEKLRRAYPNKVIFNGYDEIFISALAVGVDGAIGSTFNFMADKFIDINNNWKSNKIEEAKKIQHTVNKIIDVLCSMGVLQGEKEVLNQLGFDFGTCRKPFRPLNDEEKQLIANMIVPQLK